MKKKIGLKFFCQKEVDNLLKKKQNKNKNKK